MRTEIQISFSSLISSPSASFPLKIWERAKSFWENKYSVAVTGESLSHSSLSSSARVIHSFAHRMGVGGGAKTQMTLYLLMLGSYVIYAETNGLQRNWDRQGIKHLYSDSVSESLKKYCIIHWILYYPLFLQMASLQGVS